MLDDKCVPHHDWFTALLTSGLILGLVISYAPQHYRIINAGSSEGFSPLFLLLGATSSAAGLFNMITMQWGVVKCCPAVGFGACVEMTAGIVQIGMQWFLFNVIFVLYMIYYPPHLKYTASPLSLPEESGHPPKVKMSPEWRASVWLAWLTVLHFAFHLITTFYLLLYTPSISPVPPSPVPSPTPPDELPLAVAKWATWCGVSSAILAAIQYSPQIIHTYRTKLVGALSIPMMCIQSPGAAAMVLSIALRPGTNWTSWIMFAVSGIMQGTLLAICIAWKIRQNKLGIDDFGRPLDEPPVTHSPAPAQPASLPDGDASTDTDSIPGLVSDEADTRAIRKALSRALGSAMGSDLRQDTSVVTEQTPLLVESSSSPQGKESERSGWMNWVRRK